VVVIPVAIWWLFKHFAGIDLLDYIGIISNFGEKSELVNALKCVHWRCEMGCDDTRTKELCEDFGGCNKKWDVNDDGRICNEESYAYQVSIKLDVSTELKQGDINWKYIGDALCKYTGSGCNSVGAPFVHILHVVSVPASMIESERKATICYESFTIAPGDVYIYSFYNQFFYEEFLCGKPHVNVKEVTASEFLDELKISRNCCLGDECGEDYVRFVRIKDKSITLNKEWLEGSGLSTSFSSISSTGSYKDPSQDFLIIAKHGSKEGSCMTTDGNKDSCTVDKDVVYGILTTGTGTTIYQYWLGGPTESKKECTAKFVSSICPGGVGDCQDPDGPLKCDKLCVNMVCIYDQDCPNQLSPCNKKDLANHDLRKCKAGAIKYPRSKPTVCSGNDLSYDYVYDPGPLDDPQIKSAKEPCGEKNPDTGNCYCECGSFTDGGKENTQPGWCSDGIDNDCDGNVDKDDSDCVVTEAQPQVSLTTQDTITKDTNFYITLTYTDSKSTEKGGVHVHWKATEFEFVDRDGRAHCQNYDSPAKGSPWDGTNYWFEYYNLAPGQDCQLMLKAKQSGSLHYRAWSAVKKSCNGDKDNYRDPSSGECSPNCKGLPTPPADLIKCETEAVQISL
ncbi:MAG: hypothetical protein HZA83_01485, partial [Thaumarchaeota archaeon]|nr:hypothetical protein [Nitrososphaerota archaeon]